MIFLYLPMFSYKFLWFPYNFLWFSPNSSRILEALFFGVSDGFWPTLHPSPHWRLRSTRWRVVSRQQTWTHVACNNYRKIWGWIIGFVSATFGACLWKYVWIIGFKSPGNYSASICHNKISICLLERPKLLISLTIFIFGDTRTPKQNQENVQTF